MGWNRTGVTVMKTHTSTSENAAREVQRVLVLERSLQEPFQNQMQGWLKRFTIASLALSSLSVCVACVWPQQADWILLPAELLPWLNAPVCLLMLVSVGHFVPSTNPSDQYLRNYHPDLWKKLFPMNGLVNNPFAQQQFQRGGLDDSTDSNLVLIRQRRKRAAVLCLWTLGLVPLNWLLIVGGFILIQSLLGSA
jgi:hypothetical protein